MQYTLRNIPPALDRALRRRARTHGKSINQVVVETLSRALGFEEHPAKLRDLGDLAGSWIDDPECEAVLREQDRVDPELWR
jgi:plasmid stability protein